MMEPEAEEVKQDNYWDDMLCESLHKFYVDKMSYVEGWRDEYDERCVKECVDFLRTDLELYHRWKHPGRFKIKAPYEPRM